MLLDGKSGEPCRCTWLLGECNSLFEGDGELCLDQFSGCRVERAVVFYGQMILRVADWSRCLHHIYFVEGGCFDRVDQ